MSETIGRRIIDAQGSFCPGPLMELIVVLKEIPVEGEIEVLSTDQGSAHDIPEWLKKVGHLHLKTEQMNGVWHIFLRKMKP